MDTFLEDHPANREALQMSAKALSDACKDNGDILKAHRDFLATVESVNLEVNLVKYDVAKS